MLITEIKTNLLDQDNNDIFEGMRARSNTFPSAHSDLLRIRNSVINIRRRNDLTELSRIISSETERESHLNVKLIPFVTTDTSTINAKDYVYWGGGGTKFVMDMGVTLDKRGRLLFIKGSGRGIISGLFNKYVKKRKYHCYSAQDITNCDDYIFDDLRINEDGKLIGRIKGTSKYYSIDMKGNSNTYSSEESIGNITLCMAEHDEEIPEDIEFERKDGVTLKFTIKDQKLFVSEHKKNSHEENGYFIKSNFLREKKLLSIKKTRNTLQIETMHNGKIRITYLNPHDIKSSNIKSAHFSHKPPQNLYSALGGDPHEYCESGQPFSSTRLGNFSSLRIPLFGDAIDNFRINFKKSKNYLLNKEYAKSIYAMINAGDPGIRALISTIKNFSSMCTSARKTEVVTDNIIDMDKNFKSLFKNLSHLAINTKSTNKNEFDILNNLENGEFLSFEKFSDISIFFGIARGGIPFSPGWFIGLVGAISKKSGICFRKNDHGISLSYDKKFTRLGAFLAGSGQGMETAILKINGINYLTILPIDTNIIYLYKRDKSKILSLEIKEEDIGGFIEKIKKQNGFTDFIEENKDEISINKKTEHIHKITVEARALELRAQIGKYYEPDNYVVAPRMTAGLMFSSDLITREKTKEVNFTPGNAPSIRKDTKLNFLSFHATAISETKIMPIESIQINGNTHYIPLPIIEESRSKNIYNRQPQFKKPLPCNKDKKFFEKSKKTLSDVIELLNETDREMEKIHDIRCLTNLEMICKNNKNKRTHLLKKNNQSIKNLPIHKDFIDSLKRVKSELLGKERDSMGKNRVYKIRTNYILSEESSIQKKELEREIALIKDSTLQSSSLFIENSIREIYLKVKHFKENAEYYLSEIELESIGGLTHFSSTIPNLILYFNTRKHFSLKKILGKIRFEYKKGESNNPIKITSEFNFL